MTEVPEIVKLLARHGQDIDWIAEKAKGLKAEADAVSGGPDPVQSAAPPVPVTDPLTPEDEFIALLNRALQRNVITLPNSTASDN
jgi:hypothetical protein